MATLLGDRASQDTAEAASPVTYAHRGFPPTMLVHGNSDEVVPVQSSFLMYQALGDRLGLAVQTPTINLSVNFIAGAQQGSWVWGRGVVGQCTRTLGFTSAEIYSDNTLLATASGVYRLMR